MASFSPKPSSLTSTTQHEGRQPCFLSSSTRDRFASGTKPGTLMERRGRATPHLQICAFQSASAGTAPSTVPSSRPQLATSYDVLEVSPTATEREIKIAYRRLACRYHPDRAPLAQKEASTTKFLQIHAAYSLLSNPHRRAQYDLQLSLTAFQSAGYKSRIPGAYPASKPPSNYCSPSSPFSTGRGKSWETDQCWC